MISYVCIWVGILMKDFYFWWLNDLMKGLFWILGIKGKDYLNYFFVLSLVDFGWWWCFGEVLY